LERHFGANFWNRFEAKVMAMKVHIRHDLAELSETKNRRKQEIEQRTACVLQKIEEFNEALAPMCDIIVPPKYPVKA
jgi:hypothetical protein